MLRKRSRRVSTNAAAISSPVQMPWKRFWNFVKPLRMQLVRTAQPKHKINLLSLSTEAGGPDVGHLVCSINSMQFVRTAQFKHKHLLALYSHSPRRTGGPQAPASGALVLYRNTNTTGWKFRITEVVVFFLMKRKLSPPPPTNKILRVYFRGIPIQQVESSGLQ